MGRRIATGSPGTTVKYLKGLIEGLTALRCPKTERSLGIVTRSEHSTDGLVLLA